VTWRCTHEEADPTTRTRERWVVVPVTRSTVVPTDGPGGADPRACRDTPEPSADLR
jgi:hypothetical protein